MSGPVDVEPAPVASPKRSTLTAPDVNVLQSTPGNPGLSAASSYPGLSQVSVDYLRPWVERDLDKANNCDDPDLLLQYLLKLASRDPDSLDSSSEKALVDRCLNAVLPICNGQVDQDKKSLSSTNINNALKKYTETNEEVAMYEPFVDVSMAALESLRDLKVDGMRDPIAESDITFQRNDRKPITQHHGQATSYLEPDVVLILSKRRSDRSEEPTNDGTHASNRPNGSKKKPGVCWQDVLSVVEFKRSRKKMEGPRSECIVSPTPDAVDPATGLYYIPPSCQSTSAKQTPSK
ncbi:hypothetical protein JVT61DRAFT_4562 [Boletus reticuloceps]|uniref:Uncharacterized protein n=1 Tax=Boletus reticuloceps TaxID=495285 RepID=A0A8I2YM69_9AGAM|nr:hypothetical protein JVT61DRAFT_4562 [Boletus reticuloceps]